MPRSINKHRSLFSFGATESDTSRRVSRDNVGSCSLRNRAGKRRKRQITVAYSSRSEVEETPARRPSVCERADCDIAAVTGYTGANLYVSRRERRRKTTGRTARTRWIQVDNAREWEAYTWRTSARTLVRRRCARPLCLPARSRLLITQRRGEGMRARRAFCRIRDEHASGTGSRADGAY